MTKNLFRFNRSTVSLRRTLYSLLACAPICAAAGAQAYKVANLVSDGSVTAAVTDSNFINPWAISTSGTWWISTAGTGYNYVIPATTGLVSFKVIVPSGPQPTANGFPSGSVTTSGSTGLLLPNGTAPSFLFSTLDGTISGWNSKLGTSNALSQIVINNSSSGAVYAGLALLNTTNGSYILAPNFNSAAMEVYDSTFKPAKLAGSFSDPNLPANYAPFGVHILGTQVFVTYAQRTATAPYGTVTAPGAGVVDVYDFSGNLTGRAVTGGNLNAPWGVAYAPANFGIYSNDLLIGNFGDGIINVHDPKTFSYIGQLMDSTGKPLAYASLWELLTGGTKVTGSTGVSGGDTSTVYFTAGLAGEKHGLLGGISNGTVAGSTPTVALSTSAGALAVSAGSSGSVAVSVAPVNGFSGAVTLTCSGLPAGAACSFSPSQFTVTSTAPALGTVTITTSSGHTANRAPSLGGKFAGNLLAAFAVPFASLAFVRRKRLAGMRAAVKLFALASFFAAFALLSGCGDNGPAPVITPQGQSHVVITAASGGVTQTSAMTLTVQ